MTSGAALSVEGLSKSFGGAQKALSGVRLAMRPGEMVALIGASGSGKSTLLRHISGFVAADPGSGAVRVGDHEIQAGGRIARNVREQRADVGFIFQQFNLVGRLTVMTNVLMGQLPRIPTWRSLVARFTREEKAEAWRALKSVGIEGIAWQRASTLSGGQQQRVAIARALVQRARIILADEPIASLDPESARNVMEILARINREHGITVLVSLHQVQFARRYCTRTVALRLGEVVYDGPSADLDAGMLRRLYGAAVEEMLDGTETIDAVMNDPVVAAALAPAAASA
ncbi:MAG: phosphonate ABC transporter ATP-binding protein [Betaproteobacteria bacterium]|nr:phosphonate ABC transporter ATP-binding protein [Betaproteobacteria bacterium]PWB67148.1 MAG: phosphonate ABC transporter ATP-binding protein [Betaproteobacteria bacterium]